MYPIVLLALLWKPVSQQSIPDPREAAASQKNASSEQIRQAEELLEHGDYTAAEPVLQKLATANPKDAHILFDLGFTEEHNGKEAEATESYAAASEADPTLAEPQIALGLLRVRRGQSAAGRSLLAAAVEQPSISPALKARALRALARLDQGTDADQARRELAQAIELTGQQEGDAEATAALSASAGNLADAESGYRKALDTDPHDLVALAGLAGLLQRQGKLAEADALLTPLLPTHADDPALVAQAATLYAAEGKNDDALQLLQQLRDKDAGAKANAGLTRLYAHLLLVSGKAPEAEPLYRQLVSEQPGDPALLDDLGGTLVREEKFAEAQTVFARAVTQREAFHDDAAWGEAAGHLAFAASRNHQPEVVLQALGARATVLPNSAATLFLEATARDTLHQRKEAARAYRAFLAAADGKLPDEEFEARHRLIALEHEH